MPWLHYLLLVLLSILFLAGLAVVLFSIGFHIYAVFNPGKSSDLGSHTHGLWEEDQEDAG